MWEKIKDTFGLPIIMIGGFFYVLLLIFKFFFITPFENWYENIKNAEAKDRYKVILRGLLILLAISAFIALSIYMNDGATHYDHYDEYRNEPGW
jgi:hypothetical protein